MESFDSIDEIALGLLGVTENTARVIPFFRIELDGIDIVAIPAKTIIWLLHLKRHVPTMAYVSILASVDVRISERGRGVAVVGVSIGTEEYAVDNSGKGSDRRRRTRFFGRKNYFDILWENSPCTHLYGDKLLGISTSWYISGSNGQDSCVYMAYPVAWQACQTSKRPPLLPKKFLAQGTSYLERVIWTRVRTSLDACRRPDGGGASDVRTHHSRTTGKRFLQGGVSVRGADIEAPPQQAQARVSTGLGGLWVAVGESENNVRFHMKQDWDPAGDSSGRYRPVRGPSKEGTT